MALESTTTIQGLNIANPTPSDPRSEGDDHIRLLKNVLKAMFAGPSGTGFSSPIVAKEADLNNVFTTGVKACFHQAAAPLGWVQDATATYSNRMMRVVNTVGGGIGGVHNPVFNSVVGQHAHAQQGTFGTGVSNQSLNHNHTQLEVSEFVNDGGNGSPGNVWKGRFPFATGAADLTFHTHNVTISGQTSDVNQLLGASGAVGVFQPTYMDMILCTKT